MSRPSIEEMITDPRFAAWERGDADTNEGTVILAVIDLWMSHFLCEPDPVAALRREGFPLVAAYVDGMQEVSDLMTEESG